MGSFEENEKFPRSKTWGALPSTYVYYLLPNYGIVCETEWIGKCDKFLGRKYVQK